MGRLASGRRSKYGALPTMVDGIKFASKAEARRYGALRLLERAGEISELELQPRFPLIVHFWDEQERIGEYRGDFAYYDRLGERIVEDVKGFKTPLYKWKKRHVEAQYGIVIREVR